MARHTCWSAVPAALLILFFIPAGIIAQNSISKNNSATGPAKIIRRNAPDPELDANSKAGEEGRLLDAEKLLIAAVHKPELSSAPSWRRSLLLNSLANVEFSLRHYSDAIAAKQKALAVDKVLYHPESTQVLLDIYALAVYNRKAGNHAAADRAISEELALARRFPGLHETTLVTALWEATLNAKQEHRDGEAQALLSEGAQICQAPGALKTIICPQLLSNYYRETGETVQAEKVLSDTAAQDPANYWGHADYASKLDALDELADNYEQEGSYDLAEATLQKEIALAEAHIPNRLVAPGIYEQYGRLLEREGKDKEAEATYKHAFDMLEQMRGQDRTDAIQRLSSMSLVRLY
jgi:tetratricopeptide (TPR) repeat protein